MKLDLVSIIVPVYNASKTIDKCISSILEQTYKNIEIILINDGSKDNSLEIISKYAHKDKRIVIIDQQNSGVSCARNKGIKIAKGKYLMFIDSDDYIDSNTVSLLLEKMYLSKVDIIRFNGYIEKKDGKFQNIEFPIANNLVLISPDDNKKIVEKFFHPQKSLRCYSPLLFLKNENIILFNEKLSYLEDKAFYLENILNSKSVLFINENLYYYTYNTSSITKNIDVFVNNIKKLLDSKKYIIDILKDKQCLNVDLVNASYSSLLLYRLDYLVDRVKYKEFKLILKEIEKDVIVNENAFKDFNKIKKIQYKLLDKKFYLFYYSITKLKLKLKS